MTGRWKVTQINPATQERKVIADGIPRYKAEDYAKILRIADSSCEYIAEPEME